MQAYRLSALGERLQRALRDGAYDSYTEAIDVELPVGTTIADTVSSTTVAAVPGTTAAADVPGTTAAVSSTTTAAAAAAVPDTITAHCFCCCV